MDTWVEQHEANVSGPGLARFAECEIQSRPDALYPMLANVFDQLPYGIMIVTPGGQVLHANRMAVSAMNGKDIWISPEQRLVTLRPADAAALRRALAATAGLRRTMICLGAADRCLAVAVSPLLHSNGVHAAPNAILLLERPAVCDALGIGAFGHLNGLTPAEVTVLNALREGLRAKEVASRLQCSIATVRSHLRSIYQKTGARDLHGLIAQLAVLPPLDPVAA